MHLGGLVGKLLYAGVMVGLSAYYDTALANCVKNVSDIASDGRGAFIKFGRINLGLGGFIPDGAIVGSTYVDPAQANGVSADDVLYTCDLSDVNQLYERFATNGDDRVGGFFDAGDNYYYTWFPYVAIRMVHVKSGKPLTRYWQSYKLTPSDYEISGQKVLIRARHLSGYTAEAKKVSSLPPTSGWASAFCGNNNSSGSGIGFLPPQVYSDTVASYTCTQPNAYVELVGPGLAYDQDGEDSAYRYNFFGSRNGVAFGMYGGGSSLSYSPSCLLDNVPQYISMGSITVDKLKQGGELTANFDVGMTCSVGFPVEDYLPYIGLVASDSSMSTAAQLGAGNSNWSIYAFPDNYGAQGVAKGVGVRFSDAASQVLFVMSNSYAATSNASARGWVPVTQDASVGDPTGDTILYRQRIIRKNYTAHMSAVSKDVDVTSGDVTVTVTAAIKLP